MKDEADIFPQPPCQQHLVVVHKTDGALVKGQVVWPVAFGHPQSMPALPETLEIEDSKSSTKVDVDLSNAKAVFFVKTLEGNPRHQDMKFEYLTSNSDLWIQARMADGEVLEGRTDNAVGLLMDAGFWLWPTDHMANNKVVYIPKSSVAEFYVMGLSLTRSRHNLQEAITEDAGFRCTAADRYSQTESLETSTPSSGSGKSQALAVTSLRSE